MNTNLTVAKLGNGAALHIVDAAGYVLCNRWGSTNGVVRSPRVVADAEPTCKRCLRLVETTERTVVAEPTDAELDARLDALTVVQQADRATVTRLHGADVADFVAERYPSALPLLADGWTVDSALAHVDGTCDRVLCSGDHGDDELDRKRAALAELGWDDAQIDAAIAAAERRLCRHPRSCTTCARLDVPCGAHVVGTVGHERCTGRAVFV